MTDKEQLKAELKAMSRDELYDFSIKQQTEWTGYGNMTAKQTYEVIFQFSRSQNKKRFPASFQKVGYANW